MAQGTEGDGCRTRPTVASDGLGIPLCHDHLKAYRSYLDTIDRIKRIDQAVLDAPKLDPRYLENTPEAKRSLRRDLARQRGSMIVYYVRIGNNIKIGWTTNLKQRMTTLMPDEILATEPGEEQLERLRHQQFAHLRVPPGRERFRPDPELLDHVEMLRSHYGPPSETFPPPVAEETGLA
ncbi:GIY-YIG nuclease family protein [Nonomuraea sp. NPDC004580]|uniref:GIY-YIG nuclease family protein n=1 Tax=Nonomuraea sp. NPDC004580 TaxID=3154552 RepID=UPI0033BB8812